MQRSGKMDRTSSQGNLCFHCPCLVKWRDALQCDGFALPAYLLVIEHLCLMGFGYEHEATGIFIYVAQRNPDSQVSILEMWIPKGLILVPGSCLASMSTLQNRQIEKKSSSLTQNLFCKSESIREALRFMQLRGIVRGMKDLRRIRLFIAVHAAGELSIRSFAPACLFTEESLKRRPDGQSLFIRCDSRYTQKPLLLHCLKLLVG